MIVATEKLELVSALWQTKTEQTNKKINKKNGKKQQMLHSDSFLKLTKISSSNSRKLPVSGGPISFLSFLIGNEVWNFLNPFSISK